MDWTFYERHLDYSVKIRFATSADVRDAEAIVQADYSGYVAWIGEEPGPMLDDYESLISKENVYVLYACLGYSETRRGEEGALSCL